MKTYAKSRLSVEGNGASATLTLSISTELSLEDLDNNRSFPIELLWTARKVQEQWSEWNLFTTRITLSDLDNAVKVATVFREIINRIDKRANSQTDPESIFYAIDSSIIEVYMEPRFDQYMELRDAIPDEWGVYQAMSGETADTVFVNIAAPDEEAARATLQADLIEQSPNDPVKMNQLKEWTNNNFRLIPNMVKVEETELLNFLEKAAFLAEKTNVL